MLRELPMKPVSTFATNVGVMNTAFGNPKGDPKQIDWTKVRNQCKNIGHELGELLKALGANELDIKVLVSASNAAFQNIPDGTVPKDIDKVRDALVDIPVFATGAHHFMGLDWDRDGKAVLNGVMTRFIKDDADKEATIAKHAAAGVTDVYFEGEYPTMIMKSASDQPDAPKGKFLKSASYKEPVFYPVV